MKRDYKWYVKVERILDYINLRENLLMSKIRRYYFPTPPMPTCFMRSIRVNKICKHICITLLWDSGNPLLIEGSQVLIFLLVFHFHCIFFLLLFNFPPFLKGGWIMLGIIYSIFYIPVLRYIYIFYIPVLR